MSISSSAPWLKYYGDTPHHLDLSVEDHLRDGQGRSRPVPENDAYEFMGKKTTFAQFMQKIDNVARAFLALGIHKGDRVTICMPNCPQASACILRPSTASARSANMIHPLSAAGEIKFYLNFALQVHPDARPVLRQDRPLMPGA